MFIYIYIIYDDIKNIFLNLEIINKYISILNNIILQ